LKQLITKNGFGQKLKKEKSGQYGVDYAKDESNNLLKSFHLKTVKAIASVYFRFSHRDKSGNALSNKT